MPHISTVILAAGKSTRYKGNKTKLLESLAGLPVISHIHSACHRLLACGV